MKSILSLAVGTHFGVSETELFPMLELPKDPSHGDLALPCFSFAKKLKTAPVQFVAEEAQKLQRVLPPGFTKVQAQGGYLNFFFDVQFWSIAVLSEIQNQGDSIGNLLHIGRGLTAVVDYSSPNLAKPMSIGHLRSSVIGQALVNIFNAVGFKTLAINYLGDWGVQFGKLAWAHLNRDELLKRAAALKNKIIAKGFEEALWNKLINDAVGINYSSFDYLYALYVIFHACSEFDNDLDGFGREYFLNLEKRNSPEGINNILTSKIEETWQQFVKISIAEGDRVYKLLNIKHDLVRGESFHEPELEGIVKKLKELGLLKLSNGAQIVDLEPYGMPPCLIQKSDGATLYATRDIAAAIYRHDILKGDKLFYVVGAEQTLHFRQFFKVLELMGHKWASNCVHVPFGLYRFKEGKMSTRRGNIVFLEDVLFRAIELVKQIIKEKNPDLSNSDEVATSVGTAAVIFNDLMNDRQKNIDFDWDRILDFNGDTGPYIQYSHVRCCSVLAKWKMPIPKVSEVTLLTEKLEFDILRILGQFDDVIRLSYEQLKPNWIAHYLLDLAKAFNAFYYQHRILEGDVETQKSRIVLVDSTKTVLKKGLTLLGIKTPEAM